VDDRKALLQEWVEGEGERENRPVMPLSAAQYPVPRGWVHVGICAIGGGLTLGLFVCWLATAREQATRETTSEHLHQMAMEHIQQEFIGSEVDDPNPSAWWKEKRATLRINGDAFGGLLCFGVFAIAFGTVIGALFLCAGCLLYNKMVGGKGLPMSVPEPFLGKAMVITFVGALLNAIPGFQLLSAVVSFLVMAAMISALLPTTFARGILVILCYLLVVILVVVALAIIFGALILLVSLRYGQ
jgi:hypothetical protein